MPPQTHALGRHTHTGADVGHVSEEQYTAESTTIALGAATGALTPHPMRLSNIPVWSVIANIAVAIWLVAAWAGGVPGGWREVGVVLGMSAPMALFVCLEARQ